MEIKSLEIKQGSYADVAPLAALLDEHWIELAKNRDLMVLKPALDKYKAMEEQKQLFTFCAYVDGQIVGYSISFVFNHMHYADLLCCHNDLLFVSKPYRHSSIGGKLIRLTEDEARKRGAKLMTWHAKENTPLSEVLPVMGCKVQEIIFSKEL